MNGIGLFSDSIHSISSVFAALELLFLSFSFLFIFFVSFSFVFPSFYSDFASLGNFKALYSFFKVPMNELNEVSWIYSSLLFSTEVLGI